jgi:leucine-zipper-like transcriptional regulator 1
MYPISDLTTFCRKTLGDVPPKLVVCIPLPSSIHPHLLLILISRARLPQSLVPRFISMYAKTSLPPCSICLPLTPLVQGGRLVAERRMVTDIYMFDIETFTWEKLPQAPDPDQPRARYFHSTDACEFPNPRLPPSPPPPNLPPPREHQGITI